MSISWFLGLHGLKVGAVVQGAVVPWIVGWSRCHSTNLLSGVAIHVLFGVRHSWIYIRGLFDLRHSRICISGGAAVLGCGWVSVLIAGGCVVCSRIMGLVVNQSLSLHCCMSISMMILWCAHSES